ncbi:hypothetical protein Ac2012v2_000804 [Leucoagaricus gongylophorus]
MKSLMSLSPTFKSKTAVFKRSFINSESAVSCGEITAHKRLLWLIFIPNLTRIKEPLVQLDFVTSKLALASDIWQSSLFSMADLACFHATSWHHHSSTNTIHWSRAPPSLRSVAY